MSKRVRRSVALIVTLVGAFLFLALVLSPITSATAAGGLTITQLTWNVNGLDSNKPAPPANQGPDRFPKAVRVCNTSGVDATNLTVNFALTGGNPYISILGRNVLTQTALANGACSDFWFNILIQRNTAAWFTSVGYVITATADPALSGSSETPRQIYVEKLISQNRNGVRSIVGPDTVQVGGTYNFTVNGFTATGGYEEWEGFLNFPNTAFRITGVHAVYAVPSGATNDTEWANACGWNSDPASPTYNSCIGPANYTGGKAGGDPISWVYTVTVLGPPGVYTMTTLIYDFSGSSYHYNSDLNIPPNLKVITVTVPPTAITLDQFSASSADAAGGIWLAVGLGIALLLGIYVTLFTRRRRGY